MKSLLVVAIAAAAFGPASARAADPEAGQAKYAAACARCHGPAGRGMASFPSIRGKDEAFLVARLERYRAGEPVGPNSLLMIPMAKDLADEEIADLAAFISTKFR